MEGIKKLEVFSPQSIWLIAGASLIAIEIFLAPGTGILFAGLGAITVGGVMIAGGAEAMDDQFILCFLFTAVWAALLWKPLKAMMNNGDSGYSDFIGETATIHEKPLLKGQRGQVKWSGTIMNCEIAPIESVETFSPGDEVIISDVSKGILLVIKKNLIQIFFNL